MSDKEWGAATPRSFFLCVPMMAAVLADTHGLMLYFCLILFRSKDFNNKGRERENQPFDWKPPPSYENLPKDAVVLSDKLSLGYHLDAHIFTPAFWANHVVPPLFISINFDLFSHLWDNRIISSVLLSIL